MKLLLINVVLLLALNSYSQVRITAEDLQPMVVEDEKNKQLSLSLIENRKSGIWIETTRDVFRYDGMKVSYIGSNL